MNSNLERRSSFESGTAGLRKAKWRTIKDERIDVLFSGSVNEAITNARIWIEECTGHSVKHQTLLEWIEDGIVLCELIQSIRPGLIKKINRVKSRFAYYENFSFFLDSCRSLGLQDWQLFDPEEVLGRRSTTSPTKESQERKLRNIIATVYWLARTVQLLPGYCGPELNLSCFNIKSTGQFGGSTGSISTTDSTPGSTPEHKAIPVSVDYPVLSSPGAITSSDPESSPLLWVQKLTSSSKGDNYQFTSSDHSLVDDSPNSQTSVGSGSCSDSVRGYPRKRRETLTARVEAHNPPHAFSADLVFVQGSTSSSVFSPSADDHITAHLDTIPDNSHYSPHHLSNTFGVSDHIDSTGLLEDPIDYHSQVFTNGSGSQDSGPHFSSQRSEVTFHVNLTQTSQPDNLSNSTTHLDGTGYPPQLPSISELANNSSPIDTFDLHHSRGPNATSSTVTLTNHHPQIEFSYSQEYRDQYPTQLINQSPHFEGRDSDSSCTTVVQSNLTPRKDHQSTPDTSGNSSNTSLIVVSYSPSTAAGKIEQDKRPSYRRYSSPQQCLPFIGKATESSRSPELTPLDIDSEEMALNKHHRSSGRRQMKVVPAAGDDKENAPLIDANLMNIQLIILPGEKSLGFSLSGGDRDIPVCVDYVTGDSPSSRAGLSPGDELVSINHTPLHGKSHHDVLELLKQAADQSKILLTVQRHSGNSVQQNGYAPPTHNHLSVTRLSLDLQRVHSGALPKHMTASKIVCADDERNTSGGGAGTAVQTDEADISDLLSDINSTAVEIGSVDSRLSSTGGNDGDSRNELNHSTSLPSVSEEALGQQNEHVYHEQSSPDPTAAAVANVAASGKSQSVTNLPASESTSDDQLSDMYRRAYQSYSTTHKKARKTESLPGMFRASRGTEATQSLTQNSVGLNLQNVSLDDVHSVSRVQMDQIWQEVESSSSLTSPQDLTSPQELLPPMDSIFTQTPNDEYDAPPSSPPPLRAVQSEVTVSSRDHHLETRSSPTVTVRRNSSSISNKGIDALLNTLRSLNEKVGTYDEEEEFKMLEELLQSSKFRKAKDFHDRMRALVSQSPEAPSPDTLRIVPHARHLRHILRENSGHISMEGLELRRLLRKPHVQAALFCHDKVATKDLYVPTTYFPKSAQDHEDVILSHSVLDLQAHSLFVSQEAPLSRDVPSSRKENAAIVYLERSNRPLGCTIYKQGDAVFVGKLLKGCDAEQSCVLREGDELLEINGVALIGKSTDEIIRLMSGEAGKILAFTLIPVHDDTADDEYDEKYVRAHFSYDGEIDAEVPCKELALSFTKGEILEISNQDDPDWWQARKVFDDGGESLPGLIPARQLQQKREVLRESYLMSTAVEERSRRRSILSKFTRKKKKKIYYNQGPMSGVFQSVGHEVATYEDVVKLMPNYSRRRPIVLIGAPSVGRRTLMRKLIESNPRHYCGCVPHTTRPMRTGEMNGREYHFLSREEMERDIQDNKFLEYWESRGYMYGVSVKSVRRVIDGMRIPVLDIHPQALKVIGSSGLFPYVIFIASPRLDRLLMTRRVSSEKPKKKIQTSLSADGLNRDIQAFTESELLQLFHTSEEIQSEYGHYFDWVIVNDDFQVAADMLVEVARRIEEEPQWVPASWSDDV